MKKTKMPRKSSKRRSCRPGSHRKKIGKGKGVKCVKNPCGRGKKLSSGKGGRVPHCIPKRRKTSRRRSSRRRK